MLDLGEAVRLLEANISGSSADIENYDLINWLRELQYFRDKYPKEGRNPYLYGNPYLNTGFKMKPVDAQW